MNNLFEYKDGKLLWKISRSNAIVAGQEAGTKHTKGYRRVYFDGKTHAVHRVIWQMFNGNIPNGMQIDHIDGNTSNNKIENLRLATSKKNSLNRAYKNKAKNVSLCRETGKYKVRIMTLDKRIFLGSFEDFELASFVATEARNKYHGNFANHGVSQ
jgi:hypothetical protein